MRENDGFEFAAGLGEQPFVRGISEGGEKMPRPFPRFPRERFAASLQDEPVAALAASPGSRVDILEQFIWNVKCGRWHE